MIVLMLELKMLTVFRGLVEIAGLFLLARGGLFLLAGKASHDNFIYQLFCIITRPVLSATRRLLPKPVSEKFIPFVAFSVLLGAWIFLAYVRLRLCGLGGVNCG